MAKKRAQHRAFATVAVSLFIEHADSIEYESNDGGESSVDIQLTSEHVKALFAELLSKIENAVGSVGEDVEVHVGVSNADPAIFGKEDAQVVGELSIFARATSVTLEQENPSRGPRNAKPVALTYLGRDGVYYRHEFEGGSVKGTNKGLAITGGPRIVNGQIHG